MPGVGCMTLIPEFRRQKQVDLRDFEVILVYKASSRTVRVFTQKCCLKKQKGERKISSS